MREAGLIARVLFIIYVIVVACTVFVTTWFAAVTTSWFNLFVALLAVLVAETAAWVYAHYGFANSESLRRSAPGYIGLGVVVFGYWAAVSVYLVLVVFVGVALWHVPLQLLTFAGAAVLAGIMMIFIKLVGQGESKERFQVSQWQTLQSALHDLERKLDGRQAPGVEETRKVLAALIEQVRYSDPVAPYEIMQQDQSMHNEIVLLQYEIVEVLDDELETRSLLPVARKLREMAAQVASRNERILAMK